MPEPPRFLRIFEGKALAEELTAAGHQISEKTVQRWQSGKTPPKPQDLAAIRRLVATTVPDTMKEAAPPKWAERLLAGVMALEKEAELTDADIAAGLAQARAVLDALGIAPGSPPQSNGGASASGMP